MSAERRSWPAWAVHAYTASGAVLALFALGAFSRADYRTGFLLLYVTVIIDATDGWLARRADVNRRTPAFDGTLLDAIVDYLTFVFVPAHIVYAAPMVPAGWNGWVGCAMLLSSAYGFSHRDAKTADHFFRGFPSYWNVAVFFLYAGAMPAPLNAGVLLTLCVFVFVPIGYVYPSRTGPLRALTLALGTAWGGMMLAAIWQLPSVSGTLLLSALVFPAYYVVLSFALHRRRGTTITPR